MVQRIVVVLDTINAGPTKEAAMSTTGGIIRASGEGSARWFYGGGLHTWKASADETGGVLFAFEDSLDRGKVTPLHRHPDEDETLFVLAGEIVAVVGDDRRELGPGGFSFAPRGTSHAVAVISETARVLTLHTPGATGETFYIDASEPAIATNTDAPIDFARVGQIAQATGATELRRPPPISPSVTAHHAST